MLSAYIVAGVIAAGILGAGGYWLKRRGERRRKRQAVETACRQMAPLLDDNIQALESGNINWRRIGHGQDVTKLYRLMPGPNTDGYENFRVLGEEHPDLAEKCERHDRKIQTLRDSASELASAIQSKVRERYDRARNRSEEVPAARNLPEDGWMLMLHGIMNGGNFDQGLKGNVGDYWEEHHQQYEKILQRSGAQSAKEVEATKTELLELEKDIARIIEGLLHEAR
ncbi:MAG: hypothetical protein ACOC0A_04195 [Planctomycetota bacterium]